VSATKYKTRYERRKKKDNRQGMRGERQRIREEGGETSDKVQETRYERRKKKDNRQGMRGERKGIREEGGETSGEGQETSGKG
jgi:hypothetical protein